MAILLPQSTDALSNPDHARLHRVVAFDEEAPDKAIVVDKNGNVGIGTTEPVSELHIVGPSGESADIKIEAGSGGDRAGFYLQGHNEANDNDYFSFSLRTNVPDLVAFIKDVSTGTYHDLYKYDYVNDKIDWNENEMNNLGNVGIGTTSPAEKLEVNGNIRTNIISCNQLGTDSKGNIVCKD